MNTSPASTLMRAEITQIPDRTAAFLADDAAIATAVAALRQSDPGAIATIARGSSDHAAGFLKYAIELTAGRPVASLGPSVSTIYQAPLKLDGWAALAISQSGVSPDLVAMAGTCKRGGALTIALTNDITSPLAGVCTGAIDIAAGPERSVAATKTFVLSVVAGLALVAGWTGDAALKAALHRLPGEMERALACDWSALTESLLTRDSLYVLGRGPAMAMAGEAALKFKETCGTQASAYSTAEVMHGPVSVVGQGYPVLVLAARDAAEPSVTAIADRLAKRGAGVFISAGHAKTATALPFVAGSHPLTDALLPIVSFYGFIEALARRRGLDPDHPPHLNKVTETL